MNLNFSGFIFSFLLCIAVPGGASALELPSPPDLNKEEISTLYKDVIVVQRKTKRKDGAWLFNPLASFDFSDAPKTLYSLNLGVGYAFSDFWELYAVYAPFFISQDRPLAKVLNQEYVIDLKTPKAKSFIGGDLLWVPAYGKDSWGPYAIVRSDTFLKLSMGMIQYETGSGVKMGGLVGKTFFLSDYFNLRLAAGASQIESYIDNKKRSNLVGLLEMGLVFYMN